MQNHYTNLSHGLNPLGAFDATTSANISESLSMMNQKMKDYGKEEGDPSITTKSFRKIVELKGFEENESIQYDNDSCLVITPNASPMKMQIPAYKSSASRFAELAEEASKIHKSLNR